MSKYVDKKEALKYAIVGAISEKMTWGKVVRAIDKLPTIEVREGEWKRHPIPEIRAWDICTACGIGCRRRHYGFNENGTEWVEEANYPFCPNCGARMKG